MSKSDLHRTNYSFIILFKTPVRDSVNMNDDYDCHVRF